MNFNQKTYVFLFKNICFLFLDSENNFALHCLKPHKPHF